MPVPKFNSISTAWRAVLLAVLFVLGNATLGWLGVALNLRTPVFVAIGVIDGAGLAILAIKLISEKFQVLAVGLATGSIAPSVAQSNLSSGFSQLTKFLTEIALKIVEGLGGTDFSASLVEAMRTSITVTIVVVFLSLMCNLALCWKGDGAP